MPKPNYDVDASIMDCTYCKEFFQCSKLLANGKCDDFSYNYCMDCDELRDTCKYCIDFGEFKMRNEFIGV